MEIQRGQTEFRRCDNPRTGLMEGSCFGSWLGAQVRPGCLLNITYQLIDIAKMFEAVKVSAITQGPAFLV
jgi:hypothetical protein